MSAVDQALAEVIAQLATIAPAHEGLRDFERLNLQPETHEEVQNSIVQYDRRVELLQEAKRTLESLISDGHPSLNARGISQTAYADLQENAKTIEAAKAQFIERASTLNLTGGAQEPKS